MAFESFRSFDKKYQNSDGKLSYSCFGAFCMADLRPSHPHFQYVFFGSEMIPRDGGFGEGDFGHERSICHFGGGLLGALEAQRNRFFRHLYHLASYTRLLDTGIQSQR
jgi:hypothetical protein